MVLQNERGASIVDHEFEQALQQLLASYSLRLQHLHQGTINYQKTILDQPQSWVELHVLASPVVS
ncbi:hypothetical protein [Bradyrhizobium sp. USDA 4353]